MVETERSNRANVVRGFLRAAVERCATQPEADDDWERGSGSLACMLGSGSVEALLGVEKTERH